MPAFDAGDLVSQRMATLLILDRRLPSPPPVCIGEHLSPFLPPRTAAVARKVAAGVLKNRRRSGFALASIRQTLTAEERELAGTDHTARLERSAAVWSSVDSPEVHAWFAALGAADRPWLAAVQAGISELLPALEPMVGVFRPSLPPGVTAFMPATIASPVVVAAVQQALFQHRTPAQDPAHHVLRDWIQALNDPTLSRAVTCALILVDASTVTIRTCNLANAVQTIDQWIRPGQRHLLVQACRWRLREPKAAGQAGRPAQLYGGYVTRTFGTGGSLHLTEDPEQSRPGPIRHVIDQLTQVDLLARHASSYALTDAHGVPTGTVDPTPRWLFEDSHADTAAAAATGSRILAAQTRWVPKVVPKGQQPAQAPQWAPATATLIAYRQANVIQVRDNRPPRRKGQQRQVVTGTIAVADLLARSRCELLLVDHLQAVALFDYRLGVTLPGKPQAPQKRQSRADH